MKATEKKYAIGRIEDIGSIKKAEILAATQQNAISLSDVQKLGLVRSGDVQMHPSGAINRSYGSPDINDMFDFSDYEKDEVVDKGGRKSLLHALSKHIINVKDEIMLGDEQKALAAIQAFTELDVETDFNVL